MAAQSMNRERRLAKMTFQKKPKKPYKIGLPLLAAVLTLSFLTNCATTPTGNSGGFYVPAYSDETRKELYRELMACHDCDVVLDAMKDYKILRDQARLK